MACDPLFHLFHNSVDEVTLGKANKIGILVSDTVCSIYDNGELPDQFPRSTKKDINEALLGGKGRGLNLAASYCSKFDVIDYNKLRHWRYNYSKEKLDLISEGLSFDTMTCSKGTDIVFYRKSDTVKYDIVPFYIRSFVLCNKYLKNQAEVSWNGQILNLDHLKYRYVPFSNGGVLFKLIKSTGGSEGTQSMIRAFYDIIFSVLGKEIDFIPNFSIVDFQTNFASHEKISEDDFISLREAVIDELRKFRENGRD